MPRAKPKIERTCLVCDATFMGTPAATRCDPCKQAGLKVPAQRQKERRRVTPEELEAEAQRRRERQEEREAQRLEREAQRQRERMVTKTCLTCGDSFETTRKRATRCDPCISEGRKVKYRSCLECGSSFPVADDDMIRCSPCADLVGLDQYELTPDQEEELRAERQKARWREQLQAQRDWLDRRERAKPKGYKRMSKQTMKTPLGILWLALSHADGAAASVFHQFDAHLTEEQKVHLLTTYFRLRCKGYHPSAIAQLCPAAILEKVTDEALTELPEVEEDEWSFDPLDDLDPDMRAEVIEFQQQQSRQAELMSLGLAV